jgi:hypothetical protein
MTNCDDFFLKDFAGPWDNVTAHNAPYVPAFVDTVQRKASAAVKVAL